MEADKNDNNKQANAETDLAADLQVGQNEDVFSSETMYKAIGNALGLERESDQKKYQDQIKRLSDWAKAGGGKDTADAIWRIKQLANRIGGPSIGNNWAQHLSQYAYLEMERMQIDRELRSLEKPNGV